MAGKQDWRPFETAPKDRTIVLVYRPDAGVFTAYYVPARDENGEEDIDNYCWFTTDGGDLTGDLPTHWMPLPNGPDEEDEDTALYADMEEALEAALKYDEVIQRYASKGQSWVEGDDLDALYDDWITKSRSALRRARGEV